MPPQKEKRWFPAISRRYILASAVFIDILAVSFIVPLLPVRYRELGMSPVFIGMVGSVYSGSQIVGGIVLGLLSDRVRDRRTILLMSFAGAAISYSMVGMATSVTMLVISRVIVGTVKQTMTASKAMAAEWSTESSRAEYMAIVSSASTAAWVIGSSITGVVRDIHPAAPSVFAVALYTIDAIIVLRFLPPTGLSVREEEKKGGDTSSAEGKKRLEMASKVKPTKGSFWASFNRAFGNRAVAQFLSIKIGYGLVVRASMSMQDTWEMDRFGLRVGQLGNLRTVKSLLSITFQAFAAGRAIRYLGERKAFILSLFLGLLGTLLDATLLNVYHYAVVCVPIKLVAGQLAFLALESLMLGLVPRSDIGAALGAVDVLSSVTGVLAPILSGVIIEYGGLVAMPLAAGTGYLVLVVLTLGLLPSGTATAQQHVLDKHDTAVAKKKDS